jgi:hypothetical protein
MSNKDEYIKELEMETFELIAKVIELVNIIGWDEDDSYTFEDGEKWHKFQPLDTDELLDLMEDEDE